MKISLGLVIVVAAWMVVPGGAPLGSTTSHMTMFGTPAPTSTPRSAEVRSATTPSVSACAPVPCVADTLVLWNDTLVPGNFLAGIGVGPAAVAYDSGKGEVFVANAASDNVSVISDATDGVVATAVVGSNPYGVAYDSGTGEVFIANAASDNVSVISDATDSVVATVAVGSNPDGVAYDSGTGEVFVANEASDNVSVISDATDSVVATVVVGLNPIGVAHDGEKGVVYVSNYGLGTISIIDAGVTTTAATYLVTLFLVGAIAAFPTAAGVAVVLRSRGHKTHPPVAPSDGAPSVPPGTPPTG